VASKVARRSNPSFLAVEQITFDKPTTVTLKNQGMSMRSDHLKALRFMSLDLGFDDYTFSASEIARCAIAIFLTLPLEKQLIHLEKYRKMERKALKNAR